jgi:hypothetical protein
MKWFRWYHDNCGDTKHALIARKTQQSRTTVIAFWAYLLEEASKADERGNLESLDLEEASVALEVDTIALERIYAEMINRGMIQENQVTNWHKRQPESDEAAAARAQMYREKKKKNASRDGNGTEEETDQNREEQNNGAFEQFWSVYPRKTAKQYAKRIWDQKKLSPRLAEVVRGVEMYKRTEQWKKPDLIPHASTFLNQERWLDDLQDAPTTAPKKSRLELILEALEKGKGVKDKLTNRVFRAGQLKYNGNAKYPSFIFTDDPSQTREPNLLEVLT